VNAIGDDVTERRETRTDSGATEDDSVALKCQRQPWPHRERMHGGIAKRRDRRYLADATRLSRWVLDRLILRTHELAKKLVEEPTSVG